MAACPPPACLSALQFSVFVRQTVTPRPFFIAYTDPQKDVDVSAYIHNHALFEHGFTWIW